MGRPLLVLPIQQVGNETTHHELPATSFNNQPTKNTQTTTTHTMPTVQVTVVSGQNLEVKDLSGSSGRFS